MKRSSAFVAALFAISALASPALAQYQPPARPPIRETIDANGVDLARGVLTGRTHSVSIGGPGLLGLSWSRAIKSDGSFMDSTAIVIWTSSTAATVSVGDYSEGFTISGTDYISDQKTGSTLSLSGTTYTYTNRDGVIYTFQPWSQNKTQYYGSNRVATIVNPTGEKLTFNWESVDFCEYNIHAPDGCI